MYEFGGPTSFRALPRVPRLSFSKSQFDVDSEMIPRPFRQITSSMHDLSSREAKSSATFTVRLGVVRDPMSCERICGYARDGWLLGLGLKVGQNGAFQYLSRSPSYV